MAPVWLVRLQIHGFAKKMRSRKLQQDQQEDTEWTIQRGAPPKSCLLVYVTSNQL